MLARRGQHGTRAPAIALLPSPGPGGHTSARTTHLHAITGIMQPSFTRSESAFGIMFASDAARIRPRFVVATCPSFGRQQADSDGGHPQLSGVHCTVTGWLLVAQNDARARHLLLSVPGLPSWLLKYWEARPHLGITSLNRPLGPIGFVHGFVHETRRDRLQRGRRGTTGTKAPGYTNLGFPDPRKAGLTPSACTDNRSDS